MHMKQVDEVFTEGGGVVVHYTWLLLKAKRHTAHTHVTTKCNKRWIIRASEQEKAALQHLCQDRNAHWWLHKQKPLSSYYHY